MQKSLSSKTLLNQFDVTVTVCDRKVIPTVLSQGRTTKEKERKIDNKVLVIIGHDQMNHVQTNNKLNAILHAMDYATDTNADLVLVRNGWPTKTLEVLFNHDYQNDSHSWEQHMEQILNLRFVNQNDLDEIIIEERHGYYSDVFYNTSDEMYYYHTNASLETIKYRRYPVLEFLWTHPTRQTRVLKHDMCAVVNTANIKDSSTTLPFSVIHSRWMKKNGCLNRMGGLSHRIRMTKGISIDRKAPCLLEPSYIKSAIKKCGIIGNPIYVISDGLNPDIIKDLEADPDIGQDIRVAPTNVSWVGGDMMLGVLSDCFIGTPISTLSGNIARARIALGKDPSTNFLFPQKRKKKDDPWEFSCQDDADCLYDVRVLNHYVG